MGGAGDATIHALLFVPVAPPLACLASVSLFGFPRGVCNRRRRSSGCLHLWLDGPNALTSRQGDAWAACVVDASSRLGRAADAHSTGNLTNISRCLGSLVSSAARKLSRANQSNTIAMFMTDLPEGLAPGQFSPRLWMLAIAAIQFGGVLSGGRNDRRNLAGLLTWLGRIQHVPAWRRETS